MIPFPPPPICSRHVIFFGGNGHRPDKSRFLRPPHVVLEGALRSTFSKIARYVLPPHLRFPIIGKSHPWWQCQPRWKLLTKFQCHWSMQAFHENKAPREWSIRIPPEMHMDQRLTSLSASSGVHRRWSIECSSLPYLGEGRKGTAGRGREKKFRLFTTISDNFWQFCDMSRQISSNFTTCLSLCSCDIIRHTTS